MAKAKTTPEIQKISVETVEIKIKGLSPLIVHKWSEKVRQEMLDKQMKKTVKKQPKDPQAQFLDTIYRLNDGNPGFPADAFKKAMVRGAKQLGLTMTDMRTGFFVHGEHSAQENRELVRIDGELSRREDMVRVAKGAADIRFRGQIERWSAVLTISYNTAVVSYDHVLNMLNAAGYGVGIGDWRPERDGMFGRFEVLV